MQIYGIFTEYPWKIMENMRKIIPFLSISFHNLFRMTRFSRSFSVVFGRFLRSFLEKIREFRRISEKNGEYRRHLSVFFPFLFLFVPFHSSTPRFSSPNVKSYLIIRFFVVNIWIIRKFVVSLHCLKEIMI